MSAEQMLLDILEEKLHSDTLILPTLPDIVLQVRRKCAEPTISLQEIADVISYDPALAARIIRLANSAFLGRTIKVTTLQQAVTRIGLSQIRDLVTAMAIEQLFVCRDKLVRKWMDVIWQNSVRYAGVTVACLKFYNGRHPQSSLNTEVMALAALIHNIGALPVLKELELQQHDIGHPAFVEGIIDKTAARIGGKIVTSWEFPEELKTAVMEWRELKPQKGGVGYTDFIRLAAISGNYYADKAVQQRLLKYYVAEQLVPVPEFMQQPDIARIYQDLQSVFG